MKPKHAVVVTGGGRGIGRAIALRLSRDFNVLLVGRTESDLLETCEQIRAKKGRAEFVVGDVRHANTADQVVSKITDLKWSLKHLVCNAGIGKSSPTHEVTDELWHAAIDTNLTGSFYFSRAALPLLIKNEGGTICFIASTAGVRGFAYEAAYTASKHGVVGLAKTIAAEYAKHNITSVAVCPSFVIGEMTDRVIAGLASRRGISTVDAQKILEDRSPTGKLLTPNEVAEVVANICLGKGPKTIDSTIVLEGGNV